MKILVAAPYIIILLANALYLYTYYTPELQTYQLFLFNFLILVFSGIFLIINLNILLHRWLVQQTDKNNEGKITKKQIIQNKVKKLLSYKYLIQDMFNQGNQVVLVKIYLGIVVFKWVISLIPGILSGLLLGLYYQYKQPINRRLKYPIIKVNYYSKKVINWVIINMPRHKSALTANFELQQPQKLEQPQKTKQIQQKKQVKQIEETQQQPQQQQYQVLTQEKKQ